MTHLQPGPETAGTPAGPPLYPVDIRQCWRVEDSIDLGETLLLPEVVINSWQWVRNKYVTERAFCEGVSDPTIQPLNVGSLGAVNAWLGPSRGTPGFVGIRGALESVEKAKIGLSKTSALYSDTASLANKMRRELRVDAESQLAIVNRMVANASCNLWVGLRESYGVKKWAAAGALSRFIIEQPAGKPPALEPVLKNRYGVEGTRPPHHDIAGLYVSAPGDLFQSDPE